MFNKLSQNTVEADTIRKGKLSGSAAIILLKMLYSTNQNNIMLGNPQTICLETNITEWEFRQGIKSLKKQNIIRKYTAKEYMLNPDVSYNGDDKRYWILKHMWDTQTTTGLKSGG